MANNVKTISIEYTKKYINFKPAEKSTRREVSPGDKDRFQGWIKAYQFAIEHDTKHDELLKIGREIYKWLKGKQTWLVDTLNTTSAPVIIEFTIPKNANETQRAFIEVPFELLADQIGHLASNTAVQFCPVRRIGRRSQPKTSEYQLNTVFMAADPKENDVTLNYELEESAILNVHSRNRKMELTVDETGCIDLLRDACQNISPIDVLHISCHGTNDPELFLLMENETGNMDLVNPERFFDCLPDDHPKLLFLSACLTSEPDKTGNTYTQELVRRGFPAVMGWSGSVFDHEATIFAEEIYRNLNSGYKLEKSVSHARLSLMTTRNTELKNNTSEDWHLARLYLGSGGGVLATGKKIRKARSVEAGHREFLDDAGKVKVASRAEFVGRRRQIQDILREFRDYDSPNAGVLIHGVGRQGKSSLAARVANRLSTHKLEVVFENYDPLPILNQLKTAAKGKDNIERANDLLKIVADDEYQFESSLKDLLENQFSGFENSQPILLVIDDFERILDEPESDNGLYTVDAEHQDTITTLISVFKHAETRSKLLITSRQKFEVSDNFNVDWGKEFHEIALPSMNESEGKKQLYAKVKTLVGKNVQSINTSALEDISRINEIVKAAKGNPGLQDLLFNLFLKSPETGANAVKEMLEYIVSGAEPEDQKLHEFLENLTLDKIIGLLTPGEKNLYANACVFNLPVPETVWDELSLYIGIQEGIDYKERLIGFGMAEVSDDIIDSHKVAMFANRLFRSRLEMLKPEHLSELLNFILPVLFSEWGGVGKRRPWQIDLELMQHSLTIQHTDILLACAENALRGMFWNYYSKRAALMADQVITILTQFKIQIPPMLCLAAFDISQHVGESKKAIEYLKIIIYESESEEINPLELGMCHGKYGRILEDFGEFDKSLHHLYKALNLFEGEEAIRERAIVLGDIAYAKAREGKLNEALKLHEERKQVFENLGDLRSFADSLGGIANIMFKKGEIEEAVNLHERELEIYRELEDKQRIAETLSDIAKIKFSQDKIDEALMLYESSNSIHRAIYNSEGIASTLLNISQILHLKGIRKENVLDYLLEAFEISSKLGRLDFISYAASWIGFGLCKNGKLEIGLKYLKNRS